MEKTNFFFRKDEPVRLQRAPATASILEKDIVIRISVYAAIIFALIIFIGLCFIMQPQTYGFLWW